MQQIQPSNSSCARHSSGQKEWEALFAGRDVPGPVAAKQLELVGRLKLEFTGPTQAERLLPRSMEVGGGLEAHLVLPGCDQGFVDATAGLVASCFQSPPQTCSDDLPANTWRGTLERKLGGQSYFLESGSYSFGRIGVVDCILVYTIKGNHRQAGGSGAKDIVGVHGLYHYLSRPRSYHGLRWAVAPEYQGRGFGRRIFAHNLKLALQLGATGRWTFTESDREKNWRTLSIYERWGFKPTGICFTYNNCRQELLYLRLTPGSPGRKLADKLIGELL